MTAGERAGGKEANQQALMHGAEIVASTLNSAATVGVLLSGKNGTKKLSEAVKFDVLIVDEATQATEPSLMIPLCLLKLDVRAVPIISAL